MSEHSQTRPDSQLEGRIESVELKCMDLENTIAELNQVVIQQYQEIDLLNTRLERLRGQISGLESGAAEVSGEPPPPHY